MHGILIITTFAVTATVAAAVCNNECNWNGRCIKNNCQCFQGFYGNDCSGDCGCQGYGRCASDQTCLCADGWKWNPTQHKCAWDCQCMNGESCIGPGECGCTLKCKYGACRNGQCVCWEGYKGVDCSQYDSSIMMNKDVAVGMNLGGISYYSSEVKFVDVHKLSQQWVTERDGRHDWNTNEQDTLHLRADGYPASLEPGQKLLQLMFRGFGPHEEMGNFTALYDGEGIIDFGLTEEHILYDGKGRMVVRMPKIGSGGFTLTIHKTNPKNPLRNIRVLIPGYENVYDRFPFHPAFLENLKRYSELRFMDFLSTNGHKPEPTTWADRNTPDSYTQEGSRGGAIEYMIQLANTLGANPWFNIPHAATDDYVKNFAQLVKQTLRPDLKVYLEYSNEVWNGIFRQTKYSREQGLKLNLDSQQWKAGQIYYGRRSAEIVDIWNQVFGSDKDKLYPIFAWQTGYKDYYRQAVAALGDKIKKFKALALTGYFNCDQAADKHAKEIVSMSMSQIQDLCKKDVPDMEDYLHYYLNMSKSHGLQLVMYEGGPGVMESGAIAHFGQHTQAVTDKAIAFNKDSHMEQPIIDIMDTWFKLVTQDPSNKSPGGLFNYFSYTSTPSKYGSWGMLEYTGEDPKTVPKFRGVQRFITDHYKSNPLGPKCSFVKAGALAYGCFQQTTGVFKCGQSDNNGRSWSFYPSFNQSQGEFLVLDGYNPKTFSLYVRLTDTMGANSYYVYNIRGMKWSTLQVFRYYEEEAAYDLLPRLPNGVYDNLDAHAHCA
ncbi:uncharacterized protein LOC124141307 [Haliotis rufescens]|uniref:uncharacterized protein LOC124141307 n=1 Tax=Haliotis rufescens TaxID=6454 RepID=UPI00201F4281|nr:uncharacterized protein LOC124141307 [Haliotis rufescens]